MKHFAYLYTKLLKIRIPKWLFVTVCVSILCVIIAGVQYGRVVQLLTLHTGSQIRITQLIEELDVLKNQDQVVRNDELEKEIADIVQTFRKSVSVYEQLVSLREKTNTTASSDAMYAKILTLLADRNWASASAELSELQNSIKLVESKLVADITIPSSVPSNNTAPGSGYSRQSVQVGNTAYLVDIVAADLGSTRVIVDTASTGTCVNDCPVLPLATYVARNGAYAGINGSYFCPAQYPSCVGKTNTFDTLLMNKDKVYFNSDNNVYSTVPAVIFLGGSIRFVGQSLEWGRDTSPDGVIANRPLLVSGGNIVFTGEGEAKEGAKGNRSFVANKGNTVYIGVVHNATVAESAATLGALGMENALNLDNGGSTALWHGGYKVGPGRNLPNVILFVRK